MIAPGARVADIRLPERSLINKSEPCDSSKQTESLCASSAYLCRNRKHARQTRVIHKMLSSNGSSDCAIKRIAQRKGRPRIVASGKLGFKSKLVGLNTI